MSDLKTAVSVHITREEMKPHHSMNAMLTGQVLEKFLMAWKTNHNSGRHTPSTKLLKYCGIENQMKNKTEKGNNLHKTNRFSQNVILVILND